MMKRKFGIGPLKVNTSTSEPDENLTINAKGADREDSNYIIIPRYRNLDAKTEADLRKACAFILKDLKPSGHDLEDTRMKTDILIDGDVLQGDGRGYGAAGSYSTGSKSATRSRWPYSKRDASRSKDRVVSDSQDLEAEKHDDRGSRSPHGQSASPHQSRRRATTIAVPEEVPAVPTEFQIKVPEPVQRIKAGNQGPINQPVVDSSEESSLARSNSSTNQKHATSTGITSAVITPAWVSQRISENGRGSAITSNSHPVPDGMSKQSNVAQPQTPERLKTPPLAGPRAMGSNLEAQAVAIISRRVTNMSSLDHMSLDASWRRKSEIKAPSPMPDAMPRSETPDPSRVRYEQGAALANQPDTYGAFSNPYEVQAVPPTRAFIPPSLSESEDSSSMTDDDISSTEDKENYMSETTDAPIPTGGPSASSTTWASKMEGQVTQQEADFHGRDVDTSSLPQPLVNPKNPLRYTEPDAERNAREIKLTQHIKDKSDEPLATSRARSDSKAHSRQSSIYVEQQPQQQQQQQESTWDTDARPQPLNLKPKISSGHLPSPLVISTRQFEAQPVHSHALALDANQSMATYVPDPLPPLRHTEDSTITVKDFWKPIPTRTAAAATTTIAPQSEGIRSFSRPGTGNAPQHRRQHAQEGIEGLVKPLRTFSPTSPTYDSSFQSPLEYNNRGASWAATHNTPNTPYPHDRPQAPATAGASSSGGMMAPSSSMTRHTSQPPESFYQPPTWSIQPMPVPPLTHYNRAPSLAASTRSTTTNNNHNQIHTITPHPRNSHTQTAVTSSPSSAGPVVVVGGAAKKERRGLKKLLHRMGGGDLPPAAAVRQGAAVEGDDDYDDDQACEAPVVRFGRGW